jgi:uncharacterized protein involved in type VI secretion and phage assembly
MRVQAQQAGADHASSRAATVSSYDPQNYCAKVRLLPEDVETGWLPVKSQWVGNGWGLFAPPTPGDMVTVTFLEGDFTQGEITGRYFNDNARPVNVPSGELWLVHKSGSYFKLTNDGKLLMHDTSEIDVGNLTTTLHTLVTDAFVALFNGHTHGDAQGGNTTPPNQTMGAAHLTTVLKAN